MTMDRKQRRLLTAGKLSQAVGTRHRDPAPDDIAMKEPTS
jgi:hypothetical protein